MPSQNMKGNHWWWHLNGKSGRSRLCSNVRHAVQLVNLELTPEDLQHKLIFIMPTEVHVAFAKIKVLVADFQKSEKNARCFYAVLKAPHFKQFTIA